MEFVFGMLKVICKSVVDWVGKKSRRDAKRPAGFSF
jgi:hypothetical protein